LGTWVGPNPKSYRLLRKISELMKNETAVHYSKITMSQRKLYSKSYKNELKTNNTIMQNTTVKKLAYEGWKPSYLCTTRVSNSPS